MAIKIVVATHGNFGKELVRSAGMLAGDTSNIATLSLMPGMSFEDFVKTAKGELANIKEEKIFCLVDLFGGTPSNTMTALTRSYEMKVVTGVNLPILIDTFLKVQSGMEDLDKLTEAILKTAKEAVVVTNDKLKVNE